MTLLRRKKKNQAAPPDAADTAVDAAAADPQVDATGGEPPAADAEPTAAEAATSEVDQVDDVEPGRAAVAFAESRSPAPEFAADSSAPYNPDSAEAVQSRLRYAPSDGVIVPPRGGDEHLSMKFVVGSVQNVLTKSGASTAEEREREAAADFQAAIMPGLMGLRDAVPDAATPDDALRALTQREAEHDYPEDPEQLSLAQRDIFRTDASVYYRIRNRFEKPRRRVGWNNPWRPPPGLARPDPPRRALNRGD